MVIKLGSIMPPFILDLIYREFVRARLAEMRKELFLIRRETNDVPEAGAADQGAASSQQRADRHRGGEGVSGDEPRQDFFKI